MAINLKNREAERLLNALARRTRQGKTQLVLELLRAESARQERLGNVEERRRKIKALIRRSSRKARGRPVSADEAIGYDENGLPT